MHTTRRRISRLAVPAAGTALLLAAAAGLAHAQDGKEQDARPPSAHAATAPAPSVTPRPAAPARKPAATPPGDGTWTDDAATRFWTPERMASATDPAQPASASTTATATAPGTGSPRTRRAVPNGVAAAMPQAEHFPGLKSVGTIFSYAEDPTDDTMRAHKCTASVVDSPGHNLVLTAGHCDGGNAVFVPMYTAERPLDEQPFGFYRVTGWYTDNRYAHNTKKPVSDLDFSFGRLAPAQDGGQAQDVVGANTLRRTPGYLNKVTMVGYPSSHDPEDHPVRCPAQTEALPGFYQIQARCGGMWGGVSGGPWFSEVDWSKGTGVIIGNVGGYNGGGNDADVDWLTYSPMHGDWFFRLYDEAKADAYQPRTTPYTQPPLPYSLGSGATWAHARLLASGDYTGDGKGDLIVVWTDGEVTLYTGDGAGGFTGERRLAAPDSTWKDVKSLTGGDFSGGTGSDLLAVWKSGEVRLLPDVGTKGLAAGIKLADPGSVWTNADQIAGGSFGTAGYVSDLVVRWSDGELTDYTAVGDKGFGTEHQLQKPSDLWKHATLVTAGGFTGGNRWDTLVRWSDGGVSQYQETGPAGLGKEVKMAAAGGVWSHDSAMTAGSYDADGRPDDLVVRWSDGETTMYTHTGAAFGPEHMLVAPK
ncbi:trypsin-like serine peptidase [Streptomyces sp. AM6-12]|uniref:trypsin-like serine peptidase n=1 Tax=Streptomyces sp. AM6-12 TaxID=3345149 RepID=UPI0037B677EE